ncbi:MAG: HAMP domain-containing histidine kinase [Planctomycetes bacterium]|nr:HAMP domain-containing histidine kinase [Planctomycetota bacterium]
MSEPNEICLDLEPDRAANTRLRRRVKELELAGSRLRRLEEAQGDFLATVARELSEPLHRVRRSVQDAARAVADAAGAGAQAPLAAGMAELERALVTVSGLTDLVGLELGQARLDRRFLPLRQLLAEALERVRPAAAAAGITLMENLPAEGTLVVADRARLLETIVTVAENAVNQSSRGHFVRVGAEEDWRWVRITVQDQGRGIPAEQRERLFRPFEVVSVEGRRRGTGLGLALCRAVVQAHGGTIWCESWPNGGSAFHIRMPKEDVLAKAPAVPFSRRAHGAAVSAPPSPAWRPIDTAPPMEVEPVLPVASPERLLVPGSAIAEAPCAPVSDFWAISLN